MELCQRWIDPPKEFERPDFLLIFSGRLIQWDRSLMLNAMVDINSACGLVSWEMGGLLLLGRFLILSQKGGNFSLKVLERLLTVGLQMALLCFVVASRNSSGVKQCIIWEFQQLELSVL
ncbi:uncharacterized protein LOC126589263 [Malus sylvestris]|uniref:uncharacterized protein LOC126589263 n=1 Tax=Malus sylvestris TaxID=3752 RepID=UPI000498F22F|nr:uncharacterized protein LOC108175305 [Malus domestica]XP_050110475.1 uncharacterized protein LOC126589263 [Malus sylvestris]